MRKIVLAMMAVLLPWLASCSSEKGAPSQVEVPKAQASIVGKWDFMDAEEQSMEFAPDGTCMMPVKGQKGDKARYQLADDGTLTITFENGEPLKFKATIANNQLTLTDPDAKGEVPEDETLKLKRNK